MDKTTIKTPARMTFLLSRIAAGAELRSLSAKLVAVAGNRSGAGERCWVIWVMWTFLSGHMALKQRRWKFEHDKEYSLKIEILGVP